MAANFQEGEGALLWIWLAEEEHPEKVESGS